jgi:hypothetical protein
MRIRLVHTSDQYTKLQTGDMGTIISESTDPWGDIVVSVKWDNGSSLSLIEGIDQYEKVGA